MIRRRFVIGTSVALAAVVATVGVAVGAADRAEQPSWRKALNQRSDALDRKYGLGQYARGTQNTKDPDWLRALELRSDALDREYKLGNYSDGAPSTSAHSDALAGKIVVRISGGKRTPGAEVTDGGVAGTAFFTTSGEITDKGTVTTYRTVKGPLITLDFVTVGKRGAITFLVKIDTSRATSRWTIASGTKAYKGLQGKGTEHENATYTVSTLTGTVSR